MDIPSDLKLKKNINTFIPEKIRVAWVSFEYRNDPDKKRHLGVIAQNLECENPEYIITDKETGLKAVNYIELLIGKVAELESRIEKIERANKIVTLNQI